MNQALCWALISSQCWIISVYITVLCSFTLLLDIYYGKIWTTCICFESACISDFMCYSLFWLSKILNCLPYFHYFNYQRFKLFAIFHYFNYQRFKLFAIFHYFDYQRFKLFAIFQVLRALHIRPSTQIMSDILSRLVETVAEQGEDMQVWHLLAR